MFVGDTATIFPSASRRQLLLFSELLMLWWLLFVSVKAYLHISINIVFKQYVVNIICSVNYYLITIAPYLHLSSRHCCAYCILPLSQQSSCCYHNLQPGLPTKWLMIWVFVMFCANFTRHRTWSQARNNQPFAPTIINIIQYAARARTAWPKINILQTKCRHEPTRFARAVPWPSSN